MTEQQIISPRTGNPIRPLGRQPRLKVPPRVRDACKLIVSEGLELDAAAKRVGLTTRALRLALERPHVLAFLKAERDVFRAYISAQNIHYARKLRNKGKNENAIVNSMKYIDAQADEQSTVGVRHAPGVVIQIIQHGAADRAVTINAPDICTEKDQ